MTHFMGYVILLSAGVGASAVVVELVTCAKAAAGRWVWIGALLAIAVATVFVLVAPLPVVATPAQSVMAASVEKRQAIPIVEQVPVRQRIITAADSVLPVLWLVSSAILVLAIGYGQRRLASERRRSSLLRLNGHDVLLTESLGPAVAGVGDPVVFMPRWVLALDDVSQRLLLEHELEHARRRDTALLLSGAVATALLPWNPMVWWIARRLRLAVERDCDARVLAAHPDVRRYADLLLTAASRPGIPARLLAAHFGEHHSDLEARIEAMTDRKLKWRPTLAAALMAGLLVAVSCEAPRPEPLAPGDAPKTLSSTDPLYEFQVEKPVTMVSGSETPRYPKILREAGVEGNVLVSFVVDETGVADVATLKVIRSSHELFAVAVKVALPDMRFVPAEAGGRKVKQRVQQPFTFTLPGAIQKDASAGVNSVREVLAQSRARILLRSEKEAGEDPTVVVFSSGGTEVARYAPGKLAELQPSDISEIEVYKPRACPASAQGPCPLIRITLKPGREAAYRKQ